MQKNRIVVLGAALLSAVIASICCIIPVLALVGGISGLSANLTWLHPLRPYLIIMAILSLGFAWYRKLGLAADCNCASNAITRFFQSRAFLGVVTIVVALMAAFPSYSNIFYAKAEKRPITYAKEKLHATEIKISGMSCTGCAQRIKREIENLTGVVAADVSYENGNAVVTFDGSLIKVSDIQTVIRSAGYGVTDFRAGAP